MSNSFAVALTEEQREIVNYVAENGTKVIINAFAGCGKTTTMRAIVTQWRQLSQSGMSAHHNARVGKRFLYLVFNRDAEQAAKKAFYDKDDNAAFVHVRTHHSLALKFFMQTLADKIDNAEPVGRGVVAALRSIDKKIAEYKKVASAVCEDTNAPDDADGSCGFDDWTDLTDLADIDAYEEHCFDELYRATDESKRSAAIALGECEAVPRNLLPLDLESDQMRPFGLARGDPALDVLHRFFRDSSEEANQIDGPTEAHVRFLRPDRPTSVPLCSVQRQVLDRARQAWHETINGRVNWQTGRLIVSHDATLKLFCAWQKKSTDFISQRYHTVLFDEAQDIDCILMHWIQSMRDVVCYLVGDACQSIYNFKGALNAMSHLSNAQQDSVIEPTSLASFYLSQSFRFGQAVSQIANALLEATGRFEALQCTARLSSSAAGKTHLARTTLPMQVKRARTARPETRAEIVAKYVSHLHSESVQNDTSLQLMIVARKNNSLLTLAIRLASRGVFVSMTDKLLDKLRQAALVLENYEQLEHIDGRIDYLERVLRAVRREDVAEQMYRTLSQQSDAYLVNSTGIADQQSATPWYRFVRPLNNCGEPTFSSITSRVCNQVMSELYVLKLALHVGDLMATKKAIDSLLTNTIEGRVRREILLSTVHSAKGGEWDEVLLMNDFPDVSTLVQALAWCRSPDAIQKFGGKNSDWSDSTIKKKVQQCVKRVLLSTVLASSDRDDAIRLVSRTAKSADSLEQLVTLLDEEVHLYYVAVTRAKKILHINLSLQRFQNQLLE